MKMNYEEVFKALKSLKPFKGNSAYGMFVNGEYVVFSYETQIAKIDKVGNKQVNVKFYSTTTSKIQRLILEAWEIKYKNLSKLRKELADKGFNFTLSSQGLK